MNDHHYTGIAGSIISGCSATIAFVSIGSVQVWVTIAAGLVAIIAGCTTIYKNVKK